MSTVLTIVLYLGNFSATFHLTGETAEAAVAACAAETADRCEILTDASGHTTVEIKL